MERRPQCPEGPMSVKPGQKVPSRGPKVKYLCKSIKTMKSASMFHYCKGMATHQPNSVRSVVQEIAQ